ncbi:hypothetical protein GCM10023152_33090 [Agromyces bauzanensis]|uniref:HNH endonuclease n=1 Tax=Agromyces bauzanensis TaxID=1308924 RepID=A0A917UWX6_9MICO|nr:hypothetical protein GCM10011372_34510 [Agromyces bauzanensis]
MKAAIDTLVGDALRRRDHGQASPVVDDPRTIPQQRFALAERDGGCASCGQSIGNVEAHHIHWWECDAGPTDLENGVLLWVPATTRSMATAGSSASPTATCGSSPHPTWIPTSAHASGGAPGSNSIRPPVRPRRGRLGLA